jgi:glycosyltransferase involved in cell wall biosynthesis
MKVLIIHTFYKQKGGEDQVVANEIDLLRANGTETELLQFSNEGGTLLKLLQIGFNIGSYRKTKRKLAQFSPDVVHIHNLHFSGSAAVIYAIRAAGIPIVMTLHNYRLLCPSGSLFHNQQLFLDSVQPGFPWAAVKNGVYQESQLITFWVTMAQYIHERAGTWNKIDRFVVLGEHSRQLFLNSKLGNAAGGFTVKPNFCFPQEQAETTSAAPYFLYIGRLTQEKGIEVLLNAFAGTELPLKIVGSGPLEDLVGTFVKQNANITYLGQKSKAETSVLLKNATALVFPSIWYETFGMVVIEAFSSGIPVIASDLGNISKIVTDGYNGRTFAPGRAADLRTELIIYQYLTQEEKKEYSVNAKSTYDTLYTPQNNYKLLSGIYNEVISKRSYRL